MLKKLKEKKIVYEKTTFSSLSRMQKF